MITTVMINTTNPKSLAAFWSAFLETEAGESIGDRYIWLKPQSAGGLKLGFQKVDAISDGENRIHFDIKVQDLNEKAELALSLGAKLISKQGINYILADPEGNQFCVYEEES